MNKRFQVCLIIIRIFGLHLQYLKIQSTMTRPNVVYRTGDITHKRLWTPLTHPIWQCIPISTFCIKKLYQAETATNALVGLYCRTRPTGNSTFVLRVDSTSWRLKFNILILKCSGIPEGEVPSLRLSSLLKRS